MTIDTFATTENGFARLGLSGALLKAADKAGFASPKPIQEQAIPPLLAGSDLIGIAQTGSGKTAAFALPVLAHIAALGARRVPKGAHALVLAPTRELAVQIEEAFRLFSRGAHISTALVLGGVSRNSQVRRLRDGVDVLVATPGRLTDLVRAGDVRLSETRWLVLDEADRMLDMGFINDVRRLARATHPKRQVALFSATMPSEIEKLSLELLNEPVRVSVARQGTAAAEIRQSLIMARTRQKRGVLAGLLADPDMASVIVFARTKHGADKVTRQLDQDGFTAAAIHGNKSQNARQKALAGFRDGQVRILVATDIAARGIDVPGISHVVNYDLPDEAETYVHRIGRTGRNGASGEAITLCAPDESAKLRAVERLLRGRIEVTGDHTGEPDPAPARTERPRQPAANDAMPQKPKAKKPHRGRNNGAPARPAGAKDAAAETRTAPRRRRRRNQRPRFAKAA
ncbi:DEAD/DEAH box helicase [Nitratireductor mangrovi]|uniref:DEAD/DEAH box helicase n=1 Tax=Nitratireductor mangrovi TaxID=2599600 RepID=A0A5B8KVS7_9HYPH|nr:DEAD/DEAH box helicase [Nitratireductor mangrovi]QDY99660.1 DEAD/DEAH box helicase [Nitratireductor mangrovi]